MHGDQSKIEIFKPFGEAFELMKKILFQPFDLKKWMVIGFAAFLASLYAGLTFPSDSLLRWSAREDNNAMAESFDNLSSNGQIEWWVVALIGLGVFVLLALLLVVAWVAARGQFVFTDCIVRNRAAIVAPWKDFRVQGNSFFIFSVLALITLTTFALIGVLGLALPSILRGDGSRPGIPSLIAFGVFLFVVACVAFGLAVILRLMIPVMYRQRCRAMDAFGQIVALIRANPGRMLLYILFFIVLVIAAGLMSCIVTCATCCIAAIPYVGTVILLPIPVTLGLFSLVFLRQFGSDYDVWAGFMPPEFLAMLMPLPLPSETKQTD